MRIPEKDLILPALYIIKRDGPITTTELIEELTAVFNPSGEDAAILAGRSDSKFSQKVRNLKSHRDNNRMGIYTLLTPSGQYILTDIGEKHLNDNYAEIEYLFSNKFSPQDVTEFIETIEDVSKKRKTVIYSEEDMISEGKPFKKEATIRKRSKKLREASIEYYRKSDGKIYCSACGFCFENKYGDIGKDYIEIHHEKPIFQFSDDDFDTFISEAVTKLRPLCANCHRMIHRNRNRPLSIDELKTHIQ